MIKFHGAVYVAQTSIGVQVTAVVVTVHTMSV